MLRSLVKGERAAQEENNLTASPQIPLRALRPRNKSFTSALAQRRPIKFTKQPLLFTKENIC